MSKAFEGIRVLDLSQVLAGPSCGLQLALLGADVIKIEPPQGGDQMRNRVLASRLADQDMAAGFLTMNIGKRSLALDIKSEQGKAILFDLIRGADAILHNFRAGVVDRLGLDYESVRAVNPSIVYTVISGFGRTGPKAGDPAYDGAVQAASGMMANNGTPESGPLRTGYMPIDMMTGMTAAFATTAALMRKQRTGEGQMVDVAMLDCAIVLQAASYARHIVDDVQDSRVGN
ncbi:MAG: CoA transferase, partial [Alphaproteobacteria bacterium]|nr:CoA transferase [Alphaproteobacteria bacterium]